MKRSEKQELINKLSDSISSVDSVMVVHYKGLTVANLEGLRKELAKLNIGFKVVKNSLASIAVDKTKNEALKDFFVGPTAITWGVDPVSCAKALVGLQKSYQSLQLVGGVYNGSKLSLVDINKLSVLPSFDEIRGGLIGILVSVATKVAVIHKQPAAMMIGVLSAYAKK